MAFRAVGATRLALGRGSVNQWDERDRSNYGALATVVMAPFQYTAKFGLHVGSRIISWNADNTSLEGIKEIARNARTVQVGNCGEHAAVCFIELMALGARPIDLACFDDGGHAFVVIGLDPGSIPKNKFVSMPCNWNKEAVVADAWADKVGRADILFPTKKIVSFYRYE